MPDVLSGLFPPLVTIGLSYPQDALHLWKFILAPDHRRPFLGRRDLLSFARLLVRSLSDTIHA